MNKSVESKILQRRGVVASKQDLAILTCEKILLSDKFFGHKLILICTSTSHIMFMKV